MSWYQNLKRVFGLADLSKADIEKMSCEEVGALLYEYIDEELDAVTRARVKNHLEDGECPCQKVLLFELAFLERVRGSMDAEPVPDDLKQRIIASLVE